MQKFALLCFTGWLLLRLMNFLWIRHAVLHLYQTLIETEYLLGERYMLRCQLLYSNRTSFPSSGALLQNYFHCLCERQRWKKLHVLLLQHLSPWFSAMVLFSSIIKSYVYYMHLTLEDCKPVKTQNV